VAKKRRRLVGMLLVFSILFSESPLVHAIDLSGLIPEVETLEPIQLDDSCKILNSGNSSCVRI